MSGGGSGRPGSFDQEELLKADLIKSREEVQILISERNRLRKKLSIANYALHEIASNLSMSMCLVDPLTTKTEIAMTAIKEIEEIE